jgi:hypothetical protein
MKRVALFAVVALFAACAPKEEAPATDAAMDAPPAAAPAPMDTSMAMPDTTKPDSAAAAAMDTSKKM